MRAALCLAIALPALAAPRYVTLWEGERLAVKPGEVAELVTSLGCYADVWRDGQYVVATASWTKAEVRITPLIVAGPVEIRSSIDQSVPNNPRGFITLRLLPDVADPAASLIVVPGTNAVTVRLESSTNLVEWTAAASVTLTNVPAATFYRAKLAE